MSIEEEIKNIREEIKKISETNSEIYEKIEKLREEIERGKKSTGDEIKDFLIVCYGILGLSQEFERPYRDLEEKLKGKEGCPVLVEKQTLKQSLSTIPYFNKTIETDLYLGILNSDRFKLDIENGKIILPVDGHVTKSGDSDKWGFIRESIALHWFEIENLGKKIDLDGDEKSGLSICVGKEVENYFKGKKEEIAYVEALNLLGKIPPAEFREAYNKHIRSKRIEIINTLIGLELYGGNVQEIKEHLKKAGELGMHEDNLILPIIPGVHVNVSSYISNLCKKYRVKIE